MSGQAANETRKEVAKRLNQLEKTQQKTTATGANPHGPDHYDQGGGKKHKEC